MEVEVEENGASAGRGEVFQGGEGGTEMEVEDGEDGGTDAAPARPASADAIKQMMVAIERGHQARGGVPGGGWPGSDSEESTFRSLYRHSSRIST